MQWPRLNHGVSDDVRKSLNRSCYTGLFSTSSPVLESVICPFVLPIEQRLPNHSTGSPRSAHEGRTKSLGRYSAHVRTCMYCTFFETASCKPSAVKQGCCRPSSVLKPVVCVCADRGGIVPIYQLAWHGSLPSISRAKAAVRSQDLHTVWLMGLLYIYPVDHLRRCSPRYFPSSPVNSTL